jgi:hypothetical protein
MLTTVTPRRFGARPVWSANRPSLALWIRPFGTGYTYRARNPLAVRRSSDGEEPVKMGPTQEEAFQERLKRDLARDSGIVGDSPPSLPETDFGPGGEEVEVPGFGPVVPGAGSPSPQWRGPIAPPDSFEALRQALADKAAAREEAIKRAGLSAGDEAQAIFEANQAYGEKVRAIKAAEIREQVLANIQARRQAAIRAAQQDNAPPPQLPLGMEADPKTGFIDPATVLYTGKPVEVPSPGVALRNSPDAKALTEAYKQKNPVYDPLTGFTSEDASMLPYQTGIATSAERTRQWQMFFASTGLYNYSGSGVATATLIPGKWGAAETAAMKALLTWANQNQAAAGIKDLEKIRNLYALGVEAAGGGGSGGGGGASSLAGTRTSTQKTYDLSTLADARKYLRSYLADMLGRGPTENEVKQFLSRLNAAEKASPVVTTTTTTYDENGYATSSSSTATGGDVDPFGLADDWVESSPEQNYEYKGYQQLRYFLGMQDMLQSGGLPSGAGMRTPGAGQ